MLISSLTEVSHSKVSLLYPTHPSVLFVARLWLHLLRKRVDLDIDRTFTPSVFVMETLVHHSQRGFCATTMAKRVGFVVALNRQRRTNIEPKISATSTSMI